MGFSPEQCQDNAEEDKHLVDELRHRKEEIKKRKAENQQTAEASPADCKKQKSGLRTYLIEKHAKLDALTVRLRGEMEFEGPSFDHLLATDKADAVATMEKHRRIIRAEYDKFAKAALLWQEENVVEKLLPTPRSKGRMSCKPSAIRTRCSSRRTVPRRRCNLP